MFSLRFDPQSLTGAGVAIRELAAFGASQKLGNIGDSVGVHPGDLPHIPYIAARLQRLKDQEVLRHPD
jgi:hypothetical protein